MLFANEAFYRAFADGDLAAMDAVWASAAPVACIHPGWNLLDGREAVMASWRAILNNPKRPDISNVGGAGKVYGHPAARPARVTVLKSRRQPALHHDRAAARGGPRRDLGLGWPGLPREARSRSRARPSLETGSAGFLRLDPPTAWPLLWTGSGSSADRPRTNGKGAGAMTGGRT